MICEKCGLSYEGNFCPNGCNSPAAKKPKKPLLKRWWFWVLIVLVALLFFSCVGGGSEDTPASEPASIHEASLPDTNAEAEAPVTQDQDNLYAVGDVIDNYGLLVAYEGAEIWDGYGKYSAPEEGYQYIRLQLSAENTADDDAYISYFEFTCYADGTKAETYYGGDDVLDGGTLSTGRKTTGYIYFIVPANAAEIEVEYELNVWTDERAILVVDI